MSLLTKESFDYPDMRNRIREDIVSHIDLRSNMDDVELFEIIDNRILEYCSKYELALSTRIKLRSDLYNSFRKLDVLQELVDDDSISEIMINSYDEIFIEKKGRIIRWDGSFESEERYQDVILQIVSAINRRVDESNPIADARLDDGSRVNVVLKPVALNGSAVTIRKFPDKVLSIDDLIEKGTLTRQVGEFLDILVKSGYNIMLSGGTSSGKTTLLNALAGFIPSDERIITIEDSAELQINNIPNIVRLEVKNDNNDGGKNVTIRDLIKASLRMRPDRIIVGEVRDMAAIDLLSAYNTGHDGSISTAHSNSARDTILRLENMVLMGVDMPVDAIRGQIASALDIIVHVSRLRDKTRKITEIAEVTSSEYGRIELNYLYKFVEEDMTERNVVSGMLQRTGNGLTCTGKLDAAGYRERYDRLFEINK